MGAKAVEHYNVVFYSGAKVVSKPVINKPYPICKWFVNNNKHLYKNGLLSVERVK